MTTVLAGRRWLVVGLGSIGVLVAMALVLLRPAPPREPNAVLTFPSLGRLYAVTLDMTRARSSRARIQYNYNERGSALT